MSKGFKVNKEMCKTCIFGANSPINAKRFADLQAQWAENDIVQECHQATVIEEQIGCRGHYEAARRGEIPHPIIGIWRAMGLEADTDTLMQISERLGYVNFVAIDKE